MKKWKSDLLFLLGIVTAVYFALFGMVWSYAAALFIAYPIGIISFFIWRRIRSENRSRTRFIPMILIGGSILSISVLIYYLIFE